MASKESRSEYVANLGLTPKKGLESNVEPPRRLKVGEQPIVGRGDVNTIIPPPSGWTLEVMEGGIL